MITPKIYIAGKVTGLEPVECSKKFATACAELEVNELQPICPLHLVKSDTTWNDAMKICIQAMIYCDAVLLLDDWTQSKGATIESELAEKLGIPRFTEINQIVKHFENEGAMHNLHY